MARVDCSLRAGRMGKDAGVSDESPYRVGESVKRVAERPVGMLYRHGDLLVVPERAVLPRECVVTGESMGVERRTESLLYLPVWLRIVSFLVAPLYLLVRLSSHFVCEVEFSCGPEVGRALRLTRLIGGVFMGLAGVILLTVQWSGVGPLKVISFPVGVVTFGSLGEVGWTSFSLFCGMLLLATGILMISIYSYRLRAVGMKNGWYFVKGCSEAFLSRYPALEETTTGVMMPPESPGDEQ